MAYGVLNQNMTCEGNMYVPKSADKLKCAVIVIVMTLIICGNAGCLVVINSPRTKRLFMKRVRIMMTSLCCTDLGMGLLVCPSTVYSALYHCWPFGDAICRIEALLISALFHESTLNMVVIAVDRFCIVHLRWYNTFMTSRRFLIVVLCTWMSVFFCYSVVIFAGSQYYFDEFGVNCEPFYENEDVTLSVVSIFYFLPAVIFVASYSAIFKTAINRKMIAFAKNDKHGRMVSANIRTTKFLAAITAGFFVAISPWTLMTLTKVVAGVSVNMHVDFAITWLALSNSFWNCLIYGIMNPKFRHAALQLVHAPWLKKTLDSASRSVDQSTEYFTDDYSTYSKYKRRQQQRKLERQTKRHNNATAHSNSDDKLDTERGKEVTIFQPVTPEPPKSPTALSSASLENVELNIVHL